MVIKRSTNIWVLACEKSGISDLELSHTIDGKNENYGREGFLFNLPSMRLTNYTRARYIQNHCVSFFNKKILR